MTRKRNLHTANLAQISRNFYSNFRSKIDFKTNQKICKRKIFFIGLFLLLCAPNHFHHASLLLNDPMVRHVTEDWDGTPALQNNMNGTNNKHFPNCTCVDCEEDELCGGLWKAKKYVGMKENIRKKKIHVVVSHCKHDLDWLSNFTEGYDIASMHVISKCGVEVIGAPDFATIQTLQNVGRCDHTYAYYITTILDQKIEKGDEKNSIVMFLKDTKLLHQGGNWNNFESMIRLASSSNGFACGIIAPNSIRRTNKEKTIVNDVSISAYHYVDALLEFSIYKYSRGNRNGYKSDGVKFDSGNETLAEYYNYLARFTSRDIIPPKQELVQVCYGGKFAASVENIKKIEPSLWKALENSLTRGDNIQEGHYAERIWAYLLSTPLEPFQIEALRNHADAVNVEVNKYMKGALVAGRAVEQLISEE